MGGVPARRVCGQEGNDGRHRCYLVIVRASHSSIAISKNASHNSATFLIALSDKWKAGSESCFHPRVR